MVLNVLVEATFCDFSYLSYLKKRMTELVLIVVVNMINVYVCFCKVKQLSQTVHAMVAS